MPANSDLQQIFRAERPRLIRLAYRNLGSVSDAEDVVQEAFLKLSAASDIHNPPGWLARVVTTCALDLLRRRKRAREEYVGQWLPEPFADEGGINVAEERLDMSFAVMRTLEALSPAERAAFLLHDLYDQDFDAIGGVLNRTPATCRKLASRARAALRATVPRRPATEADVARLLAAVTMASATGDVGPLAALLSAEAELISDGGGKAVAAPNIVRGAQSVAAFLAGVGRKALATPPRIRFAMLNGGACALLLQDGRCATVMGVDLDDRGRPRTIYVQRNPDKLLALSAAP